MPLHDSIADDAVLVVLKDLGFHVPYRRMPATLGAPLLGDEDDQVFVHITPTTPLAKPMEAGSERTARPVRITRTWRALVAAALPGWTLSASGMTGKKTTGGMESGAVELRAEDRLEVPKWRLGLAPKTSTETVIVRVVGKVHTGLGGGYFTCELEQ